MEILQQAEEKIHEIKEILCTDLEPSGNFGLLSGLAGKTLFLYYYEMAFPNNQKGLWNKGLESVYNSLSLYPTSPSYCAGVVGALYLIMHLQKKNNAEIEIGSEIDDYIRSILSIDIENNNYEFLYGLMGLSNYLLHEPSKFHNEIKDIVLYLDSLKDTVVFEDGSTGYAWTSYNKVLKRHEYNLSISHGMASIIVFLSKIHKLNIWNNALIKSLVEGGCIFMLKQQIDVGIYGSFFPNASVKDGPILQRSRLAWCYGDLGIASSLFQAGMTLNNQKFIDKAVEVFCYTIHHRTELEDTHIIDAGICHGTAGVAQLYYRMWKNTKIDLLKSGGDFWIKKTLDMAYHNDGQAGYKFYNYYTNWEINDSLLEGITGVALALLSYIDNSLFDWDECLFIS